MKKLIDLPDELIPSLKRAAEKDHRIVKSWIEHTIITKLAELDSKPLKRTRFKK